MVKVEFSLDLFAISSFKFITIRTSDMDGLILIGHFIRFLFLSPDGDFLYLHRTGLPGELISLHLLSKSLRVGDPTIVHSVDVGNVIGLVGGKFQNSIMTRY